MAKGERSLDNSRDYHFSLDFHQATRFRLVYEVSAFRDRLESWFLVAMEELQATLADAPAKTEGVEAIGFRG